MNKPALLIVDDDPQVLAAVRRDLRSRYREHYTIISAVSGQEALATARELKSRGDSLAMIISDQRMPGMLGVEVETPEGGGAKVTNVLSGSPADKAGMKNDDVITHVNGVEAADHSAVIAAVKSHRPGETVKL